MPTPLTFYYRYISNENEIRQLEEKRKIRSLNTATHHKTWYTTDYYDDPHEAQNMLALPMLPLYRIGPIPGDQISGLEPTPQRRVGAAHGFDGGGLECWTMTAVDLSSTWDFANRKWR